MFQNYRTALSPLLGNKTETFAWDECFPVIISINNN